MRMLWLVLLFGPCVHSVCAQGSVDALKDATDQGQRTMDRLRPSARPNPNFIHDAALVQRAPRYPGGDEALRVDLSLGCDTTLAHLGRSCTETVTFTLRFVVEYDGRATHAEVLDAAGCPGLDDLVWCRMRALKRFEPGLLEGGPVRSRVSLPVVYQLW